MSKPSLNFWNKSCIAMAVAQAISAPVLAATIEVNTLEDTTGMINTCSLRDAIDSANADGSVLNTNCTSGSGDDTIELTGLIGELTLSSSLPPITSNISFNGPGQEILSISGADTHRIFSATGNAEVSIDGLTLSNGSAFSGAAVNIRNSVRLEVNNITLSNNSANRGAAISAYSYNADQPSIIINNSTLSGNTASNLGGAINNYKGNELIINNCTLSANSADTGGGAINADGVNNLNISNTTLSGNSSRFSAGALLIQNTDNANISNSTLSDNSANTGGALQALRANGLSIINSTFSSNTVELRGGAFYAFESDNLNISNSIFAGNESSDISSEIHFRSSSTNIETNNIFGDDSQLFTDAFTDFSPSATSNITTSTNAVGDANPNATALASIINTLGDNGGTTLTHNLVEGSPAINNGDNAVCAVEPINNFDQLGEIRPVDSVCDIGSVEYVNSMEPAVPEENFFVVPLKNDKSIIFSL